MQAPMIHGRLWSVVLSVCLAIWLGLFVALGAAAQSVPGVPDTGSAGQPEEAGASAAPTEADFSSPEAVRALMARLSDAEVRALLLERLDAVASEAAKPEDIETGLDNIALEGLRGFTSSLSWAMSVAPNLASGVGDALSRFYEPRGADGALWVVFAFIIGLAAGIGAVLLFRWPTAPLRRIVLPADVEPTLAKQISLLALRLAFEVAEVVIVLWVAWQVISLLTLPAVEGIAPSDNLVLWFFLKEPVFNALVVAAVSRFLLAPRVPALRLVHMDDQQARVLYFGLIGFALLAGIRSFLLSFLGGHGVNLADVRLGFWLTLLMYGWMFVLVWRARRGLTQSLIGVVGEVTPGERRFAELYPYLAMGLIAVVWALSETFVGLELWGLLDGRLPLTLLILVFAPGADRIVRALVYRVQPPAEGTGEMAERAFAKTRRGYIRIGRVLLVFVLMMIVQEIWNFSLRDLAGAGVGAQFAGRLIEAGLTLGVGYILVEAVAIWINGMLARETAAPEPDAEEPGGGEGGGVGESRLATVLPLISFAAQAAIMVITALTALSTLGIDTTPLLAGAGIVGIAIGFGAQTLVSDIVSGVFFLIDDAFRTGEYVEVEGTVGTVEKISVRSLRLRHHEGRVHTIPFGQIPKLTNYSRDWVIMKLRFTVPFDTDLEKVRKLFKKIGQEMVADDRFKDDFLQPFKSQGVFEVDDVGIVIRGKFMAKPGRQWSLRKEIYARVQRAFEENDLHFARKEVRVKIDTDPGTLTPEQRQAVAGAAAEAAQAAPLAGRPEPAGEPR